MTTKDDENPARDRANRRLLDAVRGGDVEGVRAALSAGADPDCVDSNDVSSAPALYLACERKQPLIVAALLERGADPDAAYEFAAGAGIDERTPCLFAALPDLEIVAALLKSGAHPDPLSTWSDDVRRSCRLLESDAVKKEPKLRALLLRHKEEADRRRLKADRSLLAAVARGDVEGVRAALAEGADPNCAEESEGARSPALYLACDRKDPLVVSALLEGGADPNAARELTDGRRTRERAPCLFAAVPDLAIVEALLKSGADPNPLAKGRRGARRPCRLLESGEVKGHPALKKLLLSFRSRAVARGARDV